MNKPYTLTKPENALPLIFDSPHSGRDYPADFDHACTLSTLQRAEDQFVDELFADAPDYNAPFLAATFPRTYIDVNRCEHDIDPELLSENWPHGPVRPTVRSDAGIGLVSRLVRPGEPIYDRSLRPAEIAHRLAHYYHPYHNALGLLLDEAQYNFGFVYHLNCHSMPSASATPQGQDRPVDICLGDRDGTACGLHFREAVRRFVEDMGYSVSINDPYKGVEILKRYANPARGRHSLQIEINKALYMNEETGEKTSNFPALQNNLTKLIAFTAEYVSAQMVQQAAD